MKRARRALLLGIAVALLGACGGGLRSRAAPLVSYVLHAPAAEAVAAKTTPAIRKPLDYAVTVLPPAVEPGLADDGVALVTGDSRLDRFAASRWPDTVPRLVSALAVRTLRNSGAIATINDAAAPFTADFLLRINVSNFEAHYTGAHADGIAVPMHTGHGSTLWLTGTSTLHDFESRMFPSI